MNVSGIRSPLHGCLRGFPAAALELSADGHVLDSNGRLEELLGRNVVNRAFADVLDQTSREKWRRLITGRGDATGGALWEFVLEGRNGLELRTFAAVWSEPAAEDTLWLVEYARDLRLEPLVGELYAANSELIHVQRELAKERLRLSRALAEAERAVRLRDEVLQVVAHDLRNPLSAIATATLLLTNDSLALEKRHKMHGVLQRAGAAMIRIVRDLLDVANIDAGRLDVDLQPTDVAALPAEVCEIFRAQAAERGVRLDCVAGDEPFLVLADAGRLVQVLSNLLDNAIRLTPADGRVSVGVQHMGDAVRFAVSDTGPGIGAEELPHIFNRFWQGARARRGSAGLGLAIAQGIAEAHHGRLWGESIMGEGSTFYLDLPAAAEPQSP